MMDDPTRLRSGSAGLEGRLLRSARSPEPPASAEDEVWRRVQALTLAGAAATGLAASTAAGAKVAGNALSLTRLSGLSGLSALKWGAVVAAIALPAAGIATVVATRTAAHGVVAVPVTTAQAVEATPIASPEPPPIVAPVAPIGVSAAPAVARKSDPPSALRRESLSLAAARTKLVAGEPRGALDEVARLGLEFPHGRLVQEREVLAIDCLAALGDHAGARARALAFVARFPESPYADHVGDVGHVGPVGGR